MPDNQLYTLLLEAHLLIEDGEQRTLHPFGLSPSGFNLLQQLECTHGKRLVDLARAILLDASTLTRLIDRLEQAGLVQRKLDPEDRRALRVILTPAGLALRSRACLAHAAAVAQHAGALDESEQRQLVELLRKLSAGLRVAVSQGS